jgi:hypothetical protein
MGRKTGVPLQIPVDQGNLFIFGFGAEAMRIE